MVTRLYVRHDNDFQLYGSGQQGRLWHGTCHMDMQTDNRSYREQQPHSKAVGMMLSPPPDYSTLSCHLLLSARMPLKYTPNKTIQKSKIKPWWHVGHWVMGWPEAKDHGQHMDVPCLRMLLRFPHTQMLWPSHQLGSWMWNDGHVVTDLCDRTKYASSAIR